MRPDYGENDEKAFYDTTTQQTQILIGRYVFTYDRPATIRFRRRSTMKRPWQHLYNHRWRKARRVFLSEKPLCAMCQDLDIVTPAVVVDHITPHRGDEELFWDEKNWQGLCLVCHDRHKAIQENRGYVPGANSSGLPLDKNHPWHKEK